jgi:hypothetical protein
MRAAHRFTGLLIAVLAGTAVAAGAAAADPAPTGTVAVSQACYVNTARAAAKITITGSGWQAGATIELTDKLNKLSATTTANTSGTFTYTVPAPVVDSYRTQQVGDQIEAYYEGTPDETGTTDSGDASSATFETTNFVVLVTGNSSRPNGKRTFELSGFAPDRTVYAHYLSAAGKVLSTENFGQPTGACGLRRVTAYEFPGGHPKRGTYTIQFDNSRSFSRATAPQYRFSFAVRTS